MKILFDKVGHNTKAFHEKSDGIELEGSLLKISHHRVSLQGKLNGHTEVSCNRCGSTFELSLDQPLKLTISDQIVESKDDLDIIEFLDGMIDISYILESEINTIKSEYHYCGNCQESDEIFEMEF